MSEHHRIFNKTVCFASLSAVAILLSACSNHFGPFYVPSGYAHHNEEYKAPPGSELVAIPDEEEEELFVEEAVAAPEPTVTEDLYVPDVSQSEADDFTPVYEEEYSSSYQSSQEQEGYVQASSSTFIENGDGFANAAQKLLDKLTSEFGQPVEPVYLKAQDTYGSRNAEFEKALRQAMMDHNYNIAAAPGMGPFTLVYGISDLGSASGRALLSVTLLSSTSRIAEKGDIHSVSQISNDSSYDAPEAQPSYESEMRAMPGESDVSYPPSDTMHEPVSLFEQ